MTMPDGEPVSNFAANSATPGSGSGHRGTGAALSSALAAAIADETKIPDLLDVLSEGKLLVPLPDDGTPVTDGSSLVLPTVTYLGSTFVPAFTSPVELETYAGGHDGHGGHGADGVIPHAVVPAAELARALPASVGIAINPGAEASIPIYPAGVAYLAAVRQQAAGTAFRVGNPPREPMHLLREAGAQLRQVPAVSEARTTWLSVPGQGEGLVVSIFLDDPADPAAQEAAAQAVERAAELASEEAEFPIDVTFPGESDPDPLLETVTSSARPFYLRF